jgi:hypothetical protein
VAGRYSGTLSPRLQAQLDADIATGRPIFYRQIPGTRTYYNPNTGQEVSEHYVLNYRQNLDESARQAVVLRGRIIGRQNRALKLSMAHTYAVRQQAISGLPYTDDDSINSIDFQVLVQRMLDLKRQTIGTFGDQKASLTDPNGEYANVLVQLGRRLENQTDFVGMSPTGYIDAVVLPTYEGNGPFGTGAFF